MICSACSTIDDLVISDDVVVTHAPCTASDFDESNTVYGCIVHDFIVINGRAKKFKSATIEAIVITERPAFFKPVICDVVVGASEYDRICATIIVIIYGGGCIHGHSHVMYEVPRNGGIVGSSQYINSCGYERNITIFNGAIWRPIKGDGIFYMSSNVVGHIRS